MNRDKQKTININGYDVPEPVRELPSDLTVYWCPSILSTTYMSHAFAWLNGEFDVALLKRGLVHLTKEAAELHSKALLSFTNGEIK
jgi:hypothetical protein